MKSLSYASVPTSLSPIVSSNNMKYVRISFEASVPDNWYEHCDECKENNSVVCSRTKTIPVPAHPDIDVHFWSVADPRGRQQEFYDFRSVEGVTWTKEVNGDCNGCGSDHDPHECPKL